MKVKINKVVPDPKQPKSQTLQQQKYIPAPTSFQQNYTGYPIYLCIGLQLPQSGYDYQYLKAQVKVINPQFKNTIINLKQQIFQNIKRVNLKREIIFQFVPSIKGVYEITIDCSYRTQYFVQGSQPPPEKKDSQSTRIKCQQPFQIKQFILSEDKASSITFPLFLQYSIESKLYGVDLICDFQFITTCTYAWYRCKNDKKVKLKKQEIYYLLYQIEPKSIKQIMSEKGITIGSLNIKYGAKGQYQKKTALKPSNKYVFFKATTLTKDVPKKDIVQVQAIFSKIYNVNFNLGHLKLIIDQKQMPQVKILKTSVDKINLDQNKSVNVTLTVICLKSGPVHLKGLSLQRGDDITVYFINDIILNVGIQPEKKMAAIMENTSQIFIDNLL